MPNNTGRARKDCMQLLVYTANFANFDKRQENEEQELSKGLKRIDYWRCTESDFPQRYNAMTPRLQARLVKMFGWQFKPDYDVYLWVDSSCRLSKPDSVSWFMDALGEGDIAVFKHPHRENIKEEADYLKERIELELEGNKKEYVLPRYDGEDIDGAVEEAGPTAPLYASTAFIYRNTPEVHGALKAWWYHTSRFHSIDQLGFSWAIEDLKKTVILKDYMNCDYLEFTRNK